MAKINIERPYPTINGFPVSPYELELPKSRFETTSSREVNNHHLCFTKRKMGLLAITQVWRDLDENQVVLPIDTHAVLHSLFSPPKELPDLLDLVDHLEEAYEVGKMLKTGSANFPTYTLISPELRSEYLREYGELR